MSAERYLRNLSIIGSPSTLVYIDSNDRLNGSNESFTIQLKSSMMGDTEKHVNINDCIIPYSYYAINDNNNTFVLTGTTGSENITLTNGNYTIGEYSSELKTQLETSTNYAGETFTPVYSKITGKMQITVSTGDFTITSNNYNYKHLGMGKTTSVASVSSVWTSPNGIDLHGPRYIDLVTSLQTNAVNTNSNFKNYQTLLRFPTDMNRNTIKYLNDASTEWMKLFNNNVDRISVELRDDDGNIIDLNGLSWQLMLEFRELLL